jgi:hypothetical protein
LLIYTMLAPVAQWIEHRSSKPMVAGSIPAGCDSVSRLYEGIYRHISAKSKMHLLARKCAKLRHFEVKNAYKTLTL